MNSVFSTIINFNMLGLLQGFHRLHVQTVLESESDKSIHMLKATRKKMVIPVQTSMRFIQ